MQWSEHSVCVTGGAGFIGSHLVDSLLLHNAQLVTVVDDFSRGSMGNLQAAQDTGRLEFHNQNLETSGVPLWRYNVVFHLAAKVTGIEYNRTHQYEMMAANMALNHHVMESVRQRQPALFVYVSTACVYPHDAPVPTPEDAARVCDPEPTNYGYGVAKWVGEQYARMLHKQFWIPTVIVRFFNAFGPRDYYDEETSHVAPALIRRVLAGEDPVTVWGTGEQTRALVDARDIARCMVMIARKALEAGSSYKALDEPWIVNIGHQNEVSIKDLARTILDITGMDAELAFDTSKPDGYPRRAADTSFLQKLIGWVPDTPLEVTLNDMIADYRRRYGMA